MNVGESWAYRARGSDPLVEVRVIRIGLRKPPRVRVRFAADEFEGREDWVPPARLKTPWSGLEAFLARERRWTAVIGASPIRGVAADYASSYVFAELVPTPLATVDINGAHGVCRVRDVAGLARYLDIDADRLRADDRSFVEDDALIAPWPVTELIARTAARRNPEPVLRHVENSEADYRHKMIYGEPRAASRTSGDAQVDADWFAGRVDEPYHRPYWDLLRSWCGTEAAARRDELLAVRSEAARVRELARAAIGALRDAGQRRAADQLERELASPLNGASADDGRA